MSSPSPGPRASRGPFRVLELFCGIGGCAEALRGTAAQVAEAIDVNHRALEIYRLNFPHPAATRNLDSLAADLLAGYGADLWWLSPPCQPFTRRGKGRDDADPRSRALLHLAGLLPQIRPTYLALENVPGFETSRTRESLLSALDRGGYEVREEVLCPSELGLPNRRRRYYLLAGRGPLGRVGRTPSAGRRLRDFLDPSPCPELFLAAPLAHRYQGALHVVDPDDDSAVSACFTAAYGRSPVLSGSFLRTAGGRLRYFSPREVLRLLGFSQAYRLPPGIPRSLAWRLAGNSLSILPVRRLLAAIPPLQLV